MADNQLKCKSVLAYYKNNLTVFHHNAISCTLSSHHRDKRQNCAYRAKNHDIYHLGTSTWWLPTAAHSHSIYVQAFLSTHSCVECPHAHNVFVFMLHIPSLSYLLSFLCHPYMPSFSQSIGFFIYLSPLIFILAVMETVKYTCIQTCVLLFVSLTGEEMKSA